VVFCDLSAPRSARDDAIRKDAPRKGAFLKLTEKGAFCAGTALPRTASSPAAFGRLAAAPSAGFHWGHGRGGTIFGAVSRTRVSNALFRKWRLFDCRFRRPTFGTPSIKSGAENERVSKIKSGAAPLGPTLAAKADFEAAQRLFDDFGEPRAQGALPARRQQHGVRDRQQGGVRSGRASGSMLPAQRREGVHISRHRDAAVPPSSAPLHSAHLVLNFVRDGSSGDFGHVLHFRGPQKGTCSTRLCLRVAKTHRVRGPPR